MSEFDLRAWYDWWFNGIPMPEQQWGDGMLFYIPLTPPKGPPSTFSEHYPRLKVVVFQAEPHPDDTTVTYQFQGSIRLSDDGDAAIAFLSDVFDVANELFDEFATNAMKEDTNDNH